MFLWRCQIMCFMSAESSLILFMQTQMYLAVIRFAVSLRLTQVFYGGRQQTEQWRPVLGLRAARFGVGPYPFRCHRCRMEVGPTSTRVVFAVGVRVQYPTSTTCTKHASLLVCCLSSSYTVYCDETQQTGMWLCYQCKYTLFQKHECIHPHPHSHPHLYMYSFFIPSILHSSPCRLKAYTAYVVCL